VEEGTHSALLEQDGLYARLYKRQFREGDEAGVRVAG
jgi:ABC-type multidrug transport system fused ATPase/permease subunit